MIQHIKENLVAGFSQNKAIGVYAVNGALGWMSYIEVATGIVGFIASIMGLIGVTITAMIQLWRWRHRSENKIRRKEDI